MAHEIQWRLVRGTMYGQRRQTSAIVRCVRGCKRKLKDCSDITSSFGWPEVKRH